METKISYEEYQEKIEKGILEGILTNTGNCPVTYLLTMLQGKWKVELVVRTMEANKNKNFYTLRTMQNKMLKAKIKNLEVLGAVFERTDNTRIKNCAN